MKFDPRRAMHTAKPFRCLWVVWIIIVGSAQASVVDVLLQRMERSEFDFGRSGGNAPFLPLAWVGVQHYGDSEFSLEDRKVEFREWSASESLFAPLWIGKKDMFLAGENVSVKQIDFAAPLTARRHITTFMPALAWLRQADSKNQVGAFAALSLTDGGSYAGIPLTNSSVYVGALALHQTSDQLTWAAGLVGMGEPGDRTLLPYLGCLWHPSKEISVALVAPWPAITYAPTRSFMLQLGASPAGAALASSDDGRRLRVGYESWNLLLSAHRRLARNVWLSVGGGWSGLGLFTISKDGDSKLNRRLNRGPVVSIQLSFRPAGAD